MTIEALLDEVEERYCTGNYSDLIEKCDEDNLPFQNYKGIGLYCFGRYGKTENILNYVLEIHPANVYALNNLAMAYMALKDYRRALECISIRANLLLMREKSMRLAIIRESPEVSDRK